MNKIKDLISVLLLALILFYPQISYSAKHEIINADYSYLFPTPFFKTSVGKTSILLGTAFGVGVAVYFTGGAGLAAAGPITSWIGSLIGTSALGLPASGGAVAAGIASLGGGSVATGGLGMAGGFAVLAAIGDLTIGAAMLGVDSRTSFQNTPHTFISAIKLPYFKDKGSEPIIKAISNINELLQEQEIEKYNQAMQKTFPLLKNAVNDKNEYIGYDLLTAATVCFNYNEFQLALDLCERSKIFSKSDNISWINYIEGLSLIALNKDNDGLKKLNQAMKDENFILPYLVTAQVYIDNKSYLEAKNCLEVGINKHKDDYTLNYMMGNVLFSLEDYTAAVIFYEKAFNETSDDTLEAVNAKSIAKCYKKLGDSKNTNKWVEKGVGKLPKSENKDETEKLILEFKKEILD